MVMNFTRYTSATNMAMNVRLNNFSMSGGSLAGTQTFSGAIACDYQGVATMSSCFFSDDKRSWDTGTSYSGGVANGTYAANYGSGSVKVAFVNFGTVAGTATITGASGNSAVVTYISATSYVVRITKDGITTTYTVTV
jgi:hypothetical protein